MTLNALLHAARVSKGVIWDYTIPTIFNKTSPLAIVLISPLIDWHDPAIKNREDLVSQWAVAASAVPYTEEAGQSVVDVLLTVSFFHFL